MATPFRQARAPRSLRLEDLQPQKRASNEDGRSELVSARIPPELKNRLEDLYILSRPRFGSISDLFRTALLEFMENLATDLDHHPTLDELLRQRTLNDVAAESDHGRMARETVRQLAIGVTQMIRDGDMTEAGEKLERFHATAKGLRPEIRSRQYLRAFDQNADIQQAVSDLARYGKLPASFLQQSRYVA